MKKANKIVALILIIALTLTIFSGCAEKANPIVTESPEDYIIEIEVDEVEVLEIVMNEIDWNEIALNSAYITEIQSVDIEVVSIDDELMEIVFDNFEEYHQVALDREQIRKDLITAGIVVVSVIVVTAVTAGVGTAAGSGAVVQFFGYAGVTSSSTALQAAGLAAGSATKAIAVDLAIGTAIDAGITAASTIGTGISVDEVMDQVVAGVSDGLKWSAFFAPVAVLAPGISAIVAVSRAVKATSAIVKNTDEVADLIKYADEVYDAAHKVANGTSSLDEAYDIYKNTSSVLDVVSKETFEEVTKNIDGFYDIIIKYNPYGLSERVSGVIITDAIDTLGLQNTSYETIYNVVKNAKSYSKLSDDALKILKEYPSDFVRAFSSVMGKDLLDDIIKNLIGNDALTKALTKYAAKKNVYALVAASFDVEDMNVLLDESILTCLSQRYGSSIVKNLSAGQSLYSLMRKAGIPETQIFDIISKYIDDGVKTVDDLTNNSDVANLLRTMFENEKLMIKSINSALGITSQNAKLINDVAIKQLKEIFVGNPTVNAENITNLFSKSSMGLNQINNELGESFISELGTRSEDVLRILAGNTYISKDVVGEIAKEGLRRVGIAEDIVMKFIDDGIKFTDSGLDIVNDFNVVNQLLVYHQYYADDYVEFLADVTGELDIVKQLKVYNQHYLGDYANFATNMSKIIDDIPTGSLDDFMKKLPVDNFEDVAKISSEFNELVVKLQRSMVVDRVAVQDAFEKILAKGLKSANVLTANKEAVTGFLGMLDDAGKLDEFMKVLTDYTVGSAEFDDAMKTLYNSNVGEISFVDSFKNSGFAMTENAFIANANLRFLPDENNLFSQLLESPQTTGDSAEWYRFFEQYRGVGTAQKEVSRGSVSEVVSIFGYDEVLEAGTSRITDIVEILPDGTTIHREMKAGKVTGSDSMASLRKEFYGDYDWLLSNENGLQIYDINQSVSKQYPNGAHLLENQEAAGYIARMKELFPDRVQIILEGKELSIEDIYEYAGLVLENVA